MVSIICVCFIICFCIALYGWGLLLHRITGYPVRNPIMTVVIGLGVAIFLGGVFNLLRFAYGWAFDGLLLVGIVLVAVFWKLRPELPRDKGEWLHVIILGLLVAVIMGFTVITQLPPKAFNFHDDFETYFAHPVRMLQTGTLFGSPLSSIGSATLGGQAVLHGIILNHFSIPYINGIDAVFGLFLCLTMSVSMIPLRATFLPVSIVCLLTVFFINPQYVNVSPLYIGSALMMVSILLFSNTHKSEGKADLPPPILIGLIYASLLAVKSSFLLFPLLHMCCLIIVLKLFGLDIRRLIRWSVNTSCMTLLFISPWILLHLPNYIRKSPFQTPPYATSILVGYPNLLSNTPLFWGATLADYTFVGVAIALAVFAFLIWSYREQIHSRRIALAGLAASGAAIVVAYPLMIFLGSLIAGYETELRYSIPFLIAGVPLIFPLDYLWSLKDKPFGFKYFISTVSLLLGVSIIFCFSQSLTDRIHQAYESGSILAFSELATSSQYINYNEEVLYGDTKFRIAAAQERIPSGEAVVVWVMTPFYLDYTRNIIFDAPGGISSSWAYIPDVNYFMFEYSGFAVRPLISHYAGTQSPYRLEQLGAKRYIIFLQYLDEIAKTADTLYNDGRIVVFRKHKK